MKRKRKKKRRLTFKQRIGKVLFIASGVLMVLGFTLEDLGNDFRAIFVYMTLFVVSTLYVMFYISVQDEMYTKKHGYSYFRLDDFEE